MGIVKKNKARDTVVSVKLTNKETELIESIALHYNVNRSDLLRYLIAKEARELGFLVPERLHYETT